MAFSEKIADRVRQELKSKRKLVEKKMFGGLCFMWRGNMLCGVMEDNFFARVSPQEYEDLVQTPGVEAMLMKGKAMTGFIIVPETKIRTAASLKKWIGYCESHCASLPPK